MSPTLRLVAYDPDWPARFAAEAARLRSSLGATAADIEHVGSTAVPGLASKPVIDIGIAVTSEAAADSCITPLEALGYEYRGPHGDDPHRRYYVRNVDGARAIQIHLYIMPANAWDQHLAFRDALRANPALAAEYEAEKYRVADAVGWDKREYSEAKGPFVQRVLATLGAAGRSGAAALLLLLCSCTAERRSDPAQQTPPASSTSDVAAGREHIATTLRVLPFRPRGDTASYALSPEEPDSFAFVWNGDSIIVQSAGELRRTGPRPAELKLPLPDGSGWGIKEIGWAVIDHDLILLFEANDLHDGTSIVMRLGPDLEQRWVREFQGFNLSTGLLDSTSLYAATITRLVRVDLATGQFIWSREDFYQSTRCDAYDYPTANGDTLTLLCSGTRPDHFSRRTGRSL